jgi:hypothetical protein
MIGLVRFVEQESLAGLLGGGLAVDIGKVEGIG